MGKSVGEKLKECRTQRQWSQQELAEKLHVTRQAVSNWERNKTLPDIYMIKEIAAVFDMGLDEYMEDARQPEIKMPKITNRLTAAAFLMIFVYLVSGGLTGRLMAELAAEMIIIAVFCQGFVHLYFSYSVKSGNFSMLAGFDGKVEYRAEEVKKVLIQMDIHISCASFGAIALLMLCSFMGAHAGETVSVCVLLSYCLDYTLAICFYNYRSIERTMVKEKDQKTAKAGYVSLIWFLAWLFLFIGAVMVKVEMRAIQNNSKESAGILGWILLFLSVTVTELFFEQYRAKKEVTAGRKYRPGKAFWVSTALTVGIMAAMFLE